MHPRLCTYHSRDAGACRALHAPPLFLRYGHVSNLRNQPITIKCGMPPYHTSNLSLSSSSTLVQARVHGPRANPRHRWFLATRPFLCHLQTNDPTGGEASLDLQLHTRASAGTSTAPPATSSWRLFALPGQVKAACKPIYPILSCFHLPLSSVAVLTATYMTGIDIPVMS